MPQVIPLGVSYWEFWNLNPRIIHVLVEAYNKAAKQEIKKQNMLMHLGGHYVADALLATVGNMFKNKGQRAYEYPNEPYTLNCDYEEGLDPSNHEDQEIALKRRQFVTSLNNLFRDIDTTLKGKDNADN